VRGKREQDAAPQLENIPWWGKQAFEEGQKYTKYNKINNNSENFRGQDCCQGGFDPMAPLSCGPGRMDESFVELNERFP